MFDRDHVKESDWVAQLAGQTRLTITPKDARHAVNRDWRAIYGTSF